MKRDNEIQSWIYDVHKNGWRVNPGHQDHGVPASFESREQLKQVLTSLVFTFSCQHAAVNFSQKDHYGFTPNAPAILRQPPAKKKGEATLQSIMSALPSKAQAAKAIATAYILTKYSEDEVRDEQKIYYNFLSNSSFLYFIIYGIIAEQNSRISVFEG